MGTVSKSMLIDQVADGAQITKTHAAKNVDAFLTAIADFAAEGRKVIISGFGTFEMKTRAARTARNPSTGLPVEVPAKTSLTFKASKPKA